MARMTDVAIVGAGPYGLSLAAHLSALGVDVRVFGTPMHFWRTGMPQGMMLKSEGFASSLYDPEGRLTLGAYCAQHGLPYADVGLPVPLETFVDYGVAFQKQFVPALDERLVAAVEPSQDGFELRLDDGEIVTASRVVVAAGIRNFTHFPPELEGLRGSLVTHSADHSDMTTFIGREVVIVGGGASALDIAALLSDNGASVTVVARNKRIAFCDPPRPRTLADKLQAPLSGLGTGWRSLACVMAPMVFYHMPQDFRLMVVRKHLGPAPGWTVRERVEKNVPVLLDTALTSARERAGRVELTVRLADGAMKSLRADHVISATGYKVDMGKLGLLSSRTLSALRCAAKTPVLSTQFESTVPGLYFVGSAAANSFGPLLRFAYGAGFAATRLSRHLKQTAPRRAMAPGARLAPATSG